MMKSMKQIQRESAAQPSIEYQDAARPRFGERLARNLTLSGILVLAVVSVRNAQLPSGQTVMTAVQEMVDPGTIWVKSALSVSCFRKHWRSF